MALLTPAVAMLNVPEPVTGPPVNPALLATLVTLPEPVGEAQTQVLPLHCRICFAAHVCVSDRLSVPPVPPPINPLPFAVVMPAIPPPPASGENNIQLGGMAR
jgi:hypothetical protein